MFNKYPYTDFHELNLDWFLSEFKTLQTNFTTLEEAVEAFKTYVTSYLDNLDVQDEINNKIDAMVLDGTFAEALSPVVADQIGPMVTEQLPGEVESRISGVVADQISGVVEEQLPDVVEEKLPEEIGTEVTDWLTENVDPVGSAVVVDSSLSVAGAAADAKVTGQARLFASRTLYPIKPNWNYGYKTIDGGTGGTSGTDRVYSDPMLCPAGSTVQYIGETNHQTIAGISFYDINMNFISGIANSGPIGTVRTTTAPNNSWYCVISTKTTIKNESNAFIYTSVVNTIRNMNDLYSVKIFHIDPNGDDSTGDGTSAHPFKSLSKAVQSGADVVHAAPGYYMQPPTITLQNKKGFRFYVDPTDPGLSTMKRPKAIFENAYDLTVEQDPEHFGVLVATHTFSSSSNWYKVFVTHELPVSPSGMQSETYNAILWECDRTNRNYDHKLKPVLTFDELEWGTFFYDHNAGKIYIVPMGALDRYDYKYLRFEEGTIFGIQNCQDVVIEGLELRHVPTYGMHVRNSDNVTIRDSVFTHAAYRNGVMIDRSSVDVINCEAFQSTGDGFGVANQGTGNFINCESHNNHDDGISHHDGSTGYVDGGSFYENGKAGIASPYSGSKVNVKNAALVENEFGIYAGTGTDSCLVSGCAIVSNHTAGIYNAGYTLIAFNNVFNDNTTDTSGAGNTIIVGNE